MEATDAQATLESFVRNWSQFEILVDKQFKFDFKGIEPAENQVNPIQQSRWELLERIRNRNQQEASPVFLQIDTKLYMHKSADGKYALNYCNVFVE